MVLVKSSERADTAYEGLKSRGFEKDMVGWRTRRIALRETVFMIVMLAASAALLTAQLELVG
jgi:energy-coupling factor transporter transmembrane protein EcfT